jgi:hypothetical protein
MKHLALAIVVFTLAACGGGGGSSDDAISGTAEGLWVGTSSSNRAITGVILDSGEYYFLYSMPGNDAFIGGVVQGNGASSNGTYTSSDAVDFNLEGLGVLSATISGNYLPQQSLSGTITYPSLGQTISFTSIYDDDYDLMPSVASLAGTFVGQVAFPLGVEDSAISVSSDGTFSAIGVSGCTATGELTARASGNVYNFTIMFDGAPCFFAGQSLTGIAYYDASTQTLTVAAPTDSRATGILFVGVK